MLITLDTIKGIAATLTSLVVIFGAVFSIYKWYLKQEKQDKDIKALKHEQWLLTEGILACLDGLEQLGCNHTVPATKTKISDHINKRAHDEE